MVLMGSSTKAKKAGDGVFSRLRLGIYLYIDEDSNTKNNKS